MKNEETQQSVRRRLLALEQMSQEELIEKWKDLFGKNPPEYGRIFMRRRLAHRIQELFYGGLPEALKERMLAEKKPVRRKRGVLRPGARLIREWHDVKHEVIVRDVGYEYSGRIHRSLTAVAKVITGTHWNGKAFFGIQEAK